MIDTPSPLLYLLGSAIPFVAAGIELAWLARYALGLRSLLTSTRSLASLSPGQRATLRGTLRVEGEPALDEDGDPCACVIWLLVGVSEQQQRSGGSTTETRKTVPFGSSVRSARLVLETGGGPCRVDLSQADVLDIDEISPRSMALDAFRVAFPDAPALPPGATSVEVREVVLQDGAEVSLCGPVTLDEGAQNDPAGYRDGRAPVMLGGGDEPLQVLAGSPAMLLARGAAVAAGMAMLIAVTLAVGVFSLRISLALRAAAGL